MYFFLHYSNVTDLYEYDIQMRYVREEYSELTLNIGPTHCTQINTEPTQHNSVQLQNLDTPVTQHNKAELRK